MKKFVFSAVAMMAFLMGSMANTIAEKTLDGIIVVDCYQVATDVVNQINSEMGGLSSMEQYRLFSIAYDLCVGNGNCHNCVPEVVINP